MKLETTKSVCRKDLQSCASSTEGEPKVLKPSEVYSEASGIPRDITDIENSHLLSPGHKAFRSILSDSFFSGEFFYDRQAVDDRIAEIDPRLLARVSSQDILAGTYGLSRLLMSIAGPENVVWDPNGFASDYRLPGEKETLLGKMLPSALAYLEFRTIPAAWKMEGLDTSGMTLQKFYRILAHPFVGILAANDEGNAWIAGPANRRLNADGSISGTTDYVLSHPSGDLVLSAFGRIVVVDTIDIWDRVIF